MTELAKVITILANGDKLPDNELQGNYKGYREGHIEPDWLLIYKISSNILVPSLVRTGSHSRLFDM